MFDIVFGPLVLTVADDGPVGLRSFYGYKPAVDETKTRRYPLFRFDLAGGGSTGSDRLTASAAAAKLRYVSHREKNGTLTLVQRSEELEIVSVLTSYPDTDAVRIVHTAKNVSDSPVTLEALDSLCLRFGGKAAADSKNWLLHRFSNYRYAECSPVVRSLFDLGLYCGNAVYHVENVGNASSRENLPQFILEDAVRGDHYMFQIESYSDWYLEISPYMGAFDLEIGGPNSVRHAWSRTLAPGESYTCVPAAIAHGSDVNGVLAEMTRYRRHLIPDCPADRTLPVIYNEYMHYSWDDPYASRTVATAPFVKEAGCDYYVIDCGWHDAPSANSTGAMYRLFGTWFEDRERFPGGIRALRDELDSMGLKFGLWIAPEVVGADNGRMLDYYGDAGFVTRGGKKISNGTGYLLDFRDPRVREYMTAALDRMIDGYGCGYIKFDGCPNPGLGGDGNGSPGAALEDQTEAFLSWTRSVMERHPDVIFEDCAGGGNRMDYRALSMFRLISTSDQTDYVSYPYIAANVLACVLPEQAAVWSYPVDSGLWDPADEASCDAKVSEERVIVNMINAVLGRIHLASRIQLLSEEKRALIREGTRIYKSLAEFKLSAVPYLPMGYASFGDRILAAGLKNEKRLVLAVWDLDGDGEAKVDLPGTDPVSASVLYPSSPDTRFSLKDGVLTVGFDAGEPQARLFDIKLA